MGSGSNFIKTKEDTSIHIPQLDLSSVPYQLLVPVSSSRYPLPFAHHPDPWLGAQVYDPFHLLLHTHNPSHGDTSSSTPDQCDGYMF